MTEINNLPPATPAIKDPTLKEVETDSSDEMSADELANSPFGRMFKGGAKKEDLRQFINNCLYPIIQECKRAEMVAKRASRRYLAIITGRRYD